MKFPNTSEKVKMIRKQLKMNQEDLVDENITRGFISMVETGRRNFSKDAAEVICRKFKDAAEKQGIELDIDVDFLMRDSIAEAEFYCTRQLETAKESGDIKEIINIAKEYKLENILAASYSRLGDIVFNEKDYIKAYLNYFKALDYCKISNMTNKEPYLYNRLGRCKFYLLEFLEALTYFNLANYHAVLHNDNKVKKSSIYNIALCNKKLNKIDAALEYIDIYLSLCDKEKEFTIYTYANILKANCYEAKDSIDTSIQILMDLLGEIKGTYDNLRGYVYNNLGEFYLKKDDLEKSLKYFDMAQEIRSDKDVSNLSHTLIEKSRIFIKQELYEQAVSLIKEGINLIPMDDDMDYWLKAHYMLAGIYLKLNCNKEAENVYETVSMTLKRNGNTYKNQLIDVYVKMANLYLEQNNGEKLKEVLCELSGAVQE